MKNRSIIRMPNDGKWRSSLKKVELSVEKSRVCLGCRLADHLYLPNPVRADGVVDQSNEFRTEK